ncbi:gliding motility-associated C-terminal domain-containing protein [Mucilaginibacter sp. HMF5004]|uniref:T9SS type B sorting domain-containing protein n=1 Tax=Mucilaginibacter rivuli TaxID=2857527 RepID=UPI001C5D59C9|nr:gliding motility-associated C-terminal domain-containing protein [Mucilaginibacter rivuli]MBW4888877.1 gliding motility-associated C-terminal domain-containing protein [Mucilaginibacter rivuli]
MNIRAFTFGIVYLLISHLCNAQTCSGSFGPALFTQNFGSGSSVIGPALSAPVGTSSYTYSGSTPPNDGQYTIANSTNGMYGTWWTIPDHTGNQGYMMVVNAKFDPTDAGGAVFYTQQAPLCMNTTYQFSVYFKNLNKVSSLKPNITITISTTGGTPLKTYFTNDIPEDASDAWGNATTFLFTTPVNQSDVVIKMENTNHGGTGNDFAMDDITIKPCGPVMVAGFGAAILPTYNNCSGTPQKDTLSVQVVSTAGYINPQYQWQVNAGNGWSNIPGATSSAPYIFNQPAAVGTYQYRLASADGTNINTSSCLIYSNLITLTVTQSPTATASTNNTTVCEGSNVTLNGGGGSSYKWTDPNGTVFSNLQNPVISNITPAQAGKYTVTVTLNGCTDQNSVTLTVQPKITATVTPTNTTICAGASTQLLASGGTSYTWLPTTGLSDPNIANPVASPTETTTYTVTATTGSCSSTATAIVNVIKAPIVSAGGAKSIIMGQSVRLNGSISGTVLTYSWSPATSLDNPNSLTPLATPTVSTTYTLTATSSCTTVTDTARVTVYDKVMAPNAFSPNGDNINDTWDILGLVTYPESVVSVYTRNGQMVYTVKGYSKPWDGTYNGKILPEGTYYYTIDLKNQGPIMSGYVTLIR